MRLRPDRSATAATAGTVANVPACMMIRTGTRIRSLAPFTPRKIRSSYSGSRPPFAST